MTQNSFGGWRLIEGYAEVAPGLRLHYVEQGRGPLVVLLHGFPDFWYGWRRQIGALAEAGFRVVAPDQRGYNLSDKPLGVASYGVRHLVDDIAALIRACGETRVFLVGHDWGGGVAWVFAMVYPEMVARLVILNCPHPARMFAGLRRPAQLARSWYMFLFQLPWLPEALAARRHFWFLRGALRGNRGSFNRRDLEKYAEAYARPGALTAMINWYRAMFRGRPSWVPIEVPVLVVWGEDDRYLGRDLATPPADLVPHASVERVPNATHWVQLDAWELVNERLVAFFAATTKPLNAPAPKGATEGESTQDAVPAASRQAD